MLVIPAIDLKDGQCVRLTQGRKSEVKVYDGNPIEMAKAFASAGARLIHVVDLDGAFSGHESPNRQIAREIVEAGVAVEFGGGLRTAADVLELIEIGVARVVLGTLAVESCDVLESLTSRFGARICVGIDARDGEVMTRGWQQGTKISAVEFAQRIAALGVQRIIYTDVARDGMLTGPNIEQTVEVARASGLRLAASGGIASLDDIRRLIDADEPLIDSVIIGKALYERRFTLEEALAVCQNRLR
jgi:phosphoribosylformimino-5-aminoimidazole carboxamide ribotide isomerase